MIGGDYHGGVIAPRLEWLLPDPVAEPPTFTGFGRPVSTLLARRGFRDDAGLQAFLQAGAGALHDLSRMADADRALDRIDEALRAGERIAIWGDYDADGMTAIVVWVEALRRLGADPVRYVPSRLAEGYGLSESGLRELSASGVQLVITCDCGVSNAAEVEVARALGLDVVITDHHLPPAVLPRAVAVVDPHRPDCAYPDVDLTGAGLSYKLAAALLARHGLPTDGLAAVAAIGTIADMAPMTGESRAIVRLGLDELARTSHAGLRALLARSCESPGQPTARDLAFGVVPRINAAGRIADAEVAMSLLLETDPTRADAMADELELVHERRREMSKVAIDAARLLAEAIPGEAPLVIRDDAWAPGLLGLVAGRLADDLARPVVAAALVGDEVRGSVRAPVDFHVAAALEACAAHLTKRGGPRSGRWIQRASLVVGGVRGRVRSPRTAARRGIGRRGPASRPPAGRPRSSIAVPRLGTGRTSSAASRRTAPDISSRSLPSPGCASAASAGSARMRPTSHSACCAGSSPSTRSAFGMDAERSLPDEGALVDLVGTLERDTFGGMARLRLRVLDYADAAASPLLTRRTVPVELARAG